MNNLDKSKKLGYAEGDQIRGIAEPYPRSIYRVVKIDEAGVHLHWESLKGWGRASNHPQCEPRPRLLQWDTPNEKDDPYPWCDFEGAMDFRLATKEEIKMSYSMER